MASIRIRGNSYNVVYTYRDKDNISQRMWETYYDEIEAAERKVLLDLFKKRKDHEALRKAAEEYKAESSKSDIVSIAADNTPDEQDEVVDIDKTQTLFSDLVEKVTPLYARKKRLAPGSYDSFVRNMEVHILPYFEGTVANDIDAESIDNFVDHLSKKKCSGSKAYNKSYDDIPTLSSSTIQKIYSNLYVALGVGKEWGYIKEVPRTIAPTVKYQKRNAWDNNQVLDALNIIDDKLLHLAIHFIYICSLRSGEALGTEISNLNLDLAYVDIQNTLTRVSDKAMDELEPKDIYKVFPKVLSTAKSQLVLKSPKTEASARRNYLTKTLVNEIQDRLDQIESDKHYYGESYNDYGLLLCMPNGNPIETRLLEKWFKTWQKENGITELIEIQGLRKSSSMYKLRLNNYNYQEVMADTGHTTQKTLTTHYNEVFEKERQEFTQKIEDSFYQTEKEHSYNNKREEEPTDIENLIAKIKSNPVLAKALATELA